MLLTARPAWLGRWASVQRNKLCDEIFLKTPEDGWLKPQSCNQIRTPARFGQDKEKRRWVWIGYRRSLLMLCPGPDPTYLLYTRPSGGSPHQYMCSSHPHSSVGETNQNIQEEYFNLAYYLHFTFYFQMQTVYHPHATIAATIQISIWSTYLQLHISCTQHTTFALAPQTENIRAPLW